MKIITNKIKNIIEQQEERAKKVLISFFGFIIWCIPGAILTLLFGGREYFFNSIDLVLIISTPAFLIVSMLASILPWFFILLIASLPCYILTGKSAFTKIGIE